MAGLEESSLVRGLVTLPRVSKARGEEVDADKDPLSPLREGVVDNLRHLLPLISVCDSESYSVSKRVRHLNNLAKVIKHVGHVIDPYYPMERVIENVRLALASSVKEVRAGALRVLRYLLHSKEAFTLMLNLRIDILVARSLDVPPVREIERLQAMRFIRQALSVFPHRFPQTLVAPLVSILLQDSEPADNLIWSCMATLAELAVLNPELAARSGAIKALLRGLLKCQTVRISESVILTLTYLLNNPSSRKYIRSQLDLESVLAPITDLHYRYLVDDVDKSLMRNDHDTRVEASKKALVAMLKSWPGVFCLCSPRNKGMSALLSMLPLAKPLVQREILDVLYSVFQLKVPEWTDSYHSAVTSIDPAQSKMEWTLSEGWVAEEGKDLLPPRTRGRTNLVDCYQALLLAALMEAGLFEYLVEVVVQRADRLVSVMATILMGQLLHLANTIVPPDFSSDSHCLPDLIASAMAFNTQAEWNRASEVISCLDRVHQMKKQGVKPSSLYLKLILEQSGYFAKLSSDQELFQHIPADIDELVLSGMIKDTNVLNTKEYTKWNWNLIFSILQHPSLRNPQHLEDTPFQRFIKRLCNLFKPSNHLYSIFPYSEASSRRYSSVGQQLVKYLCQVEARERERVVKTVKQIHPPVTREELGPSGFLVDLISDIAMELSQVTASKLTADVFSISSVANKLARDYFLFLGTVSFHKVSLLSQCKVYGPLLDICNYQNRSDLMKLILSTLDFGHDTHSRVILSKILTSTVKDMRLYATRHMRVLLRAKMPFFNSWGLELLIPQLYDLEKQVAMEAVDILDEACEEESFLEALVLQQPALLHLGEKGLALFTRFISVKRGFTLMTRLGFLDIMLEKWRKEMNMTYVSFVEGRLAETLTSYKQTDEGEYIRRTNTSLIQPKAFVPVHFYGQLVQHEEGCILLENEGHVQTFAETIRKRPIDQPDILSVKAAVWALGHIGSSPGGLDLLVREEVIGDIVEMAEESPILSIRGTCFYALCLISKTPPGATVLLDEGWTTVQHSLEEKWPLVFENTFETMDETTLTSPEQSPVRSFPPLFGSFEFGSLPSVYRSPQLSKVASFGVLSHSIDASPPRERLHQVLHTRASDGATPKPTKEVGSPTRTMSRSVSRRNRRYVVSVKETKRSPSLLRLQLDKSVGGVGRTAPHEERPRSVADLLLVEHKSPMQPYSLPPRALSRSISGGGRLRSSVVGGASCFVGVCLPMDVTAMFDYEEETFEGCRTKSVSAPDFDQENLSHNVTQCLECMLSLENSTCSDDSLHPLQSASNLSPDMRYSRLHASDGSSVGKTQSRSPAASPRVSEKVKIDGVGGSSGEEGGKKGEGKHDSELQLEGKKSRSSSPLVRMKRVDIEEPGEREKGKETEVEQPASQDSRELKTSSGDETSEKGSSSTSSGAKGEIVIVVGSSTSKASHGDTTTTTTEEDTTSVSSETTTQSMVVEESSQEGRKRLHKGILEIIYNLSTEVSVRKNTVGLNLVWQRFPSVSQDVCLYSKVMDLLSTYHYSLNTRRFIQSKFEWMTFSCLFAAKSPPDEDVTEEDLASSTTSSRRESISSVDTDFDPKVRRRSSTGDVSRFKEKMRSLQREPREVEAMREMTNTNANNSVDSDLGVMVTEEEQATGDIADQLGVPQTSRSCDGSIVNVAYDL